MGGVEYGILRADERPSFLALMGAAFVDEDTAHFARYLDLDPNLDHDDTVVARDGGRIVSAVQVFTRTIRLRGRPLVLGGIGSVATHPAHEGRGHASTLLRRAEDEMRARGMALALLFTGRVGFYARLGWIVVPHRLLVARVGPAPGSAMGRRFRSSDLPGVKRTYDVYSGGRERTTLRDDAYWRAQLGFAGSPDEDFRVVERDGRIVAYARRVDLMGLARIIEHGCAPGAEPDLSVLLEAMAPPDAPLFLPDCDARLEHAIGERFASCEGVAFPDQMWRVLDRRRLALLAGLPAGAEEAELLTALVATDEGVFWPSDRF